MESHKGIASEGPARFPVPSGRSRARGGVAPFPSGRYTKQWAGRTPHGSVEFKDSEAAAAAASATGSGAAEAQPCLQLWMCGRLGCSPKGFYVNRLRDSRRNRKYGVILYFYRDEQELIGYKGGANGHNGWHG